MSWVLQLLHSLLLICDIHIIKADLQLANHFQNLPTLKVERRGSNLRWWMSGVSWLTLVRREKNLQKLHVETRAIWVGSVIYARLSTHSLEWNWGLANTIHSQTCCFPEPDFYKPQSQAFLRTFCVWRYSHFPEDVYWWRAALIPLRGDLALSRVLLHPGNLRMPLTLPPSPSKKKYSGKNRRALLLKPTVYYQFYLT